MKKQINSLSSLLLVLCLLGCTGQSKKSYEDFPMEVTNEFRKVEIFPQAGFPESYTRYEYYPKQPMVIQGVPCKEFTLNGNGKLITFTLSADHEINGTLLPIGTCYQARDCGEDEDTEYILTLPERVDILGYTVLNKPAQGIHHHLDLYKDGKLKVFVSAEDVKIDGILCKGGKKQLPIFLDQKGNLMKCVLAKDITVDGKIYSARSIYEVSKINSEK